MKFGERISWIAVVGTLVAAALYPYVFEPVPYKNVTLLQFKKQHHKYFLQVSFEKADCARDDVIFLGYRVGIPVKLDWEPLDGFENNEDRTEGFHVLQGNIVTNGAPYEALEIRTRHYCDGIRVDKTFIHINLNEDGGLNNATS